MPFVEGESLRDRLKREKQLPIADAVRIATEVAARARLRAPPRRHPPRHQAGEHPAARRPGAGGRLRHRARCQQGRRQPDDRDRDVARHADLHEPRTGDGRAGDHRPQRRLRARRVTYEMLTGEPPFTGPTAQAIVAKVMTEKPIRPTDCARPIPAAGRGRGAHRAAEAAGRSLCDRGGVRCALWPTVRRVEERPGRHRRSACASFRPGWRLCSARCPPRRVHRRTLERLAASAQLTPVPSQHPRSRRWADRPRALHRQLAITPDRRRHCLRRAHRRRQLHASPSSDSTPRSRSKVPGASDSGGPGDLAGRGRLVAPTRTAAVRLPLEGGTRPALPPRSPSAVGGGMGPRRLVWFSDAGRRDGGTAHCAATR